MIFLLLQVIYIVLSSVAYEVHCTFMVQLHCQVVDAVSFNMPTVRLYKNPSRDILKGHLH